MENAWRRIDGPTKISLSEANAGDDARGEYAWSSLYGCGLARCEVTHTLVVADMMEEWSDDNRAYILEGAHTYIVLPLEDWDVYGDFDDSKNDDYEYETPGLYDYELGDAERAYTALDEMALVDMAWSFTGPETRSESVYSLKPSLRDWDEAMKAGAG